MNENGQVKLSTVAVGNVAKVGEYEFVVLEHLEEGTALILKNLLQKFEKFGEDDNNYTHSVVEKVCNDFAISLGGIIGKENVLMHTVDLTSEDGLKDYGVIERQASLLTADMYRKFVDILDKYNPKDWWWLATPHSTKRHENARWGKCVSPAGYFNRVIYYYSGGVRPFCILKSNIFVSK